MNKNTKEKTKEKLEKEKPLNKICLKCVKSCKQFATTILIECNKELKK